MLCITHHSMDPYINIASEEHLLRNFSEDIFMLYINEPSIIIGKHQNAFAEINHRFVEENHIKVIRRLSGGGTVFHDSGNLNFCFIRNGNDGNLIDFKRFTQPILDVLHQMGVPAERSGRNDLIIKGLKFSGNAEHVYKKRTLHHGTLLFSSQLNNLRAAIKVNSGLYEDKAVKSVRSSVTNIAEHLPTQISLEEFTFLIEKHVTGKENDAQSYTFSNEDIANIQHLVNNKYSTWEWNYGYSPRFTYKNQGTIGNNHAETALEIDNGIIQHSEIKINDKVDDTLSQVIQGIQYKMNTINEKLKEVTTENSYELLNLLF